MVVTTSVSEKTLLRSFFTAANSADRFAESLPVAFNETFDSEASNVILDPNRRFQRVMGFGGGLTESAAMVLSRVPADCREAVLQAYFSPETGLGYTFGRTHINSCDFSRGEYSYCDTPDDLRLESFNIAPDTAYLIPLIKAVQGICGNELKLIASPWSPPAWMKSNEDMKHGGRLLPQYYPVWAQYFVKYIEAYATHGIPIWGLTIQNEPEAKQVWESCLWTVEEEREFVLNHLGPCLHEAGFADVNILIWDHNKDLLLKRIPPILDDRRAASYVSGVAFHWYGGEHFDQLAAISARYPEMLFLSTESCVESPSSLDDWTAGELYGSEILGNFKSGMHAFVDWNICLNEQGGPNHVGNFCDAPVIIEESTGTVHYRSSYYYIGHFSKFVTPGSVRIDCTSNDPRLEAVAFLRENGQRVLVVMNRSDDEIVCTIGEEDLGAPCVSKGHSIMTAIY